MQARPGLPGPLRRGPQVAPMYIGVLLLTRRGGFTENRKTTGWKPVPPISVGVCEPATGGVELTGGKFFGNLIRRVAVY